MVFFHYAQEQVRWHKNPTTNEPDTMTSPTLTVLPSPRATSLLSSPESITSTQSTRGHLRTPVLHISTPLHHRASTVPREIDLVTLPRTEPIQPTQPAEMKQQF